MVTANKFLRRLRRIKPFDVINVILLFLLSVIMLYPFVYIFAIAFNTSADTLRGVIWLYPREFTFENIAVAFQDTRIYMSLLVSLARVVVTTVLAVLLTVMLAFGILDKNLIGRKFFIKYIFFSTLFTGGIIPFFLLMRDLHLANTFWIYVMPALYSFYNTIIVRVAFEAVPASLAESARLDGAGEFRILFRIYFPLSMPAIATIALFSIVFHWNDWFAGAFYVSDERLKPAATLLQEIISAASSDPTGPGGPGTGSSDIMSQSLQMAFVVILVTPVIIVYPFLQKYFVKGAVIGSIKE